MKTLFTDKAPAAVGPYSQAKVVGGLLFASGQIPLDPKTGSIVAGGIVEQTEQVCKNIDAGALSVKIVFMIILLYKI